MACFPIKSDQVDEILEHWRESAKWHAKAKDFLRNKLNEEEE